MLYYYIVRDGEEDKHPALRGPFHSVRAAQEHAEGTWDIMQHFIFTVIGLTDKGTSEHQRRGYMRPEPRVSWY